MEVVDEMVEIDDTILLIEVLELDELDELS
jgi:hypothetical protein